MKRLGRVRQRLAAVALIGVPLLSFPIVGLPSGEWFGLPASFVYLFAAWAGLIAVAAWITERRAK